MTVPKSVLASRLNADFGPQVVVLKNHTHTHNVLVLNLTSLNKHPFDVFFSFSDMPEKTTLSETKLSKIFIDQEE